MENKSGEKNRLRQGVRVTFKKNETPLLDYLEGTEEGCSAYIKKLIKEDMKKNQSEKSKDALIVMTVPEFIEAIKEASSGSEFKMPQASTRSVKPLPVTEEINTYEKSDENQDEINPENIQKEIYDNNKTEIYNKNDVTSDIKETEDVPVLKDEDTEAENNEGDTKEKSNTVSTVKPSKNFSISDLNF